MRSYHDTRRNGLPKSAIIRSQTLVLLLLFVSGVTLAITLAPQYGQSWDDEYDADTGRNALQAYAGSRAYLITHDQRYYGPAFFMFSEISVRIVQKAFPAAHQVDIRHGLNFISFLLSLPAIYQIARRLFPKQISIYLIILVFTQPLLFGHAFINEKDIPLMTAILWAFTLGLQAFEVQHRREDQLVGNASVNLSDLVCKLRDQWTRLPIAVKLIAISLPIISLFIILDFGIGSFTLHYSYHLIERMFAGRAWQPLQSIFNIVATDSYKTPLSLYLDRFYRVYLWVRIPIAFVIVRINLWIFKRTFPNFSDPFQATIARTRPVVVAGAVLGLAASLRLPAAYIGILVVLFAFYNYRRSTFISLTIYFTSALLVLYLAWPYLWESPLSSIVETIQVLSNFPPHRVLYLGEVLQSSNLPWHYLPVLLGVQLTITSLILVPFSIGILLFRRMEPTSRMLGGLLLAMFGLPFTYIIATGTPLYGNTRQVLFLLPPLIILTGFALTEIYNRLHDQKLRTVVVFTLLIPGVWGIRISTLMNTLTITRLLEPLRMLSVNMSSIIGARAYVKLRDS